MQYFNTSIPFIVMGLTSMLLQITVLRLLLSTFSGNELDIGITLSFWLIYVGSGSYFGRKLKFKHAFALSFILIALLCQPTALAIKGIRTVLALDPGESASFLQTIMSTAVSLFPLCFIIGLQFPLAVSFSGISNAAGRVYGLEALGAFIGGVLFTFAISSRISAFELCLLLSLINVLIASCLSRKLIFTFIMLIPVIFYFGFHNIAGALPWHGIEISKRAESRYGEIAVIKVRDQSSVYANGHLFFTYPDSQSEEMSVHLPMAVHPSPSKILVIGGSPGTLKEFLKYHIDIDFVELDPKIVEVSLSLLKSKEDTEAVKRTRIIVEDGRRFIKGINNPTYDMIILNLPQPSTASINRFYTNDFFNEAKGVLKKDGILVISMPQSTGYIGKRMQTASGSVYNSLKSVFRYVELTAQEYGGIFASDSVINTDPEVLENRFILRAIQTKHFNLYLFRDAFSPLNTDYVRKRLNEIKLVNTDLQPSAYLYNLLLWTEVHGGNMLYSLPYIKGWYFIFTAVILLLIISLITFRKKRRTIYFSIFTTGFSGMSFSMAVILAYQSIYGYVYEMIGILSAIFMIGLWSGTVITRHVITALKILFYLEVMTIVLAVVSPLFFKAELLFYVLVFMSGAITGGQFSTANLSINEPESGGKLYAADLIGSFLGALISSLLIIPLFGISNALLLVAFIKSFSAMMILSIYPKFFKI